MKNPVIAQHPPGLAPHRFWLFLTHPWQRLDARWFQLLFLVSFLALGALARDFALTPAQVFLTFTSALLTQAAWQWGLDLPGKKAWSGYLSALVSSLGISILVRADSAWVHPLLACLAMSSKYLIRSGPAGNRGHFLNPANLAAFAAWAWLPGAWLSPGQWGSDSLAALWFMALGGLVTQRISRWDVSLSFLSVWALLLALRLWALDYAWNPGAAMWLQQIGNGAVLLFAFFMISDPMTTPQRRSVRIGYAVLVALAAFVWQYLLFRPHGLIVALFVASWLVPLCNRLWPQPRFAWEAAR
ncbi:MAG: RnfABCDGE type electron transport complex subunit D [Pseudomonadota bacterium]|nr:RnfABCDGE type electron transport complex subunit D [Pseudomonadota bacterium]